MPYTLTRQHIKRYSALDFFMIAILMVMGVFLVTLGIYKWRSMRQTAVLPASVPAAVSSETSSETAPADFTQSRLHWEEDRLARLQMDYDNVNAQIISASAINNQLDNLSATIRTLQQQIVQNQIQLGATTDEESDFQAQNSIERNNARIELENRLLQIQADQAQLQNQPVPAATPSPSAASTDRANSNSPPVYDSAGNLINTGPAAFAPAPSAVPANAVQNQIVTLEQQKNQVASAIKVNDLEAENRALQARRDLQSVRANLLTTRDDLQSQLKDAQEEFSYWQTRKKQMGNEGLRRQRLEALQTQINEQLGRIAQIRAGR